VRHRDSGGGRCGKRRADSRHHLDLDAGTAEGLGLLTPATEHERVATLQPDHPASRPAVLHEQLVDVRLQARLAWALAHIDPHGRLGREVE
jgi:hypothetical protein